MSAARALAVRRPGAPADARPALCAALAAVVTLAWWPAAARAQDTAQSGVRIGITYAPGTRPTLAVVRSARVSALDTVRAVVERDLDHSDRFEVIRRPDLPERADSVALRRAMVTGPVQVMVVVDTTPGGGAARVSAFDATTAGLLYRADVELASIHTAAGRHRVHRLSDALLRAVMGQVGVAATTLVFVKDGGIWRVDADGFGAAPLRTAGAPALSPALSPDGRRLAYTAFVRSGQPLVVQDLASGRRDIVPGTEEGLNITPSWSPDGRRLAFARGTDAGTDIYLSPMADGWPVPLAPMQRLTVGRFADNLSPTWSPDGSRLAFISNRAGTPQLYVMNADGTGQEVMARFDFGATGPTNAPAWSPDGQFVAFHRDVAGAPQIFVYEVATRAQRQLTGAGRNEDPAWAGDSRHLAFVSSRGGARELWVVDLETGRLRQVTTVTGVRLPDWSRTDATEGRP